LPEEQEDKKLKIHMRKAPEIARIRFKMQGRKNQIKQVMIKDKATEEHEYGSVTINVVFCMEESPPGISNLSFGFF
jgi:hypothetical protein